jgi:hypothetical protein
MFVYHYPVSEYQQPCLLRHWYTVWAARESEFPKAERLRQHVLELCRWHMHHAKFSKEPSCSKLRMADMLGFHRYSNAKTKSPRQNCITVALHGRVEFEDQVIPEAAIVFYVHGPVLGHLTLTASIHLWIIESDEDRERARLGVRERITVNNYFRCEICQADVVQNSQCACEMLLVCNDEQCREQHQKHCEQLNRFIRAPPSKSVFLRPLPAV